MLNSITLEFIEKQIDVLKEEAIQLENQEVKTYKDILVLNTQYEKIRSLLQNLEQIYTIKSDNSNV